jgi:hypothetical protein
MGVRIGGALAVSPTTFKEVNRNLKIFLPDGAR